MEKQSRSAETEREQEELTMKRKWVRVLTPLVLVLCMTLALSFPGRATEAVDLGRNCSLTVAPGSFGGEYLSEDLMKANIVIDLYQVAAADENKANGVVYDGYGYRLLEPYGNEDAGLQIGEDMTNEDWREQAQRAARIAFDMTGQEEFGGNVQDPVRDGAAVNGRIGDLDPGLYLLIARWSGDDQGEVGYRDVEKYVSAVRDEEDGYKIVTTANSEECVYAFEPQLVSLPGKELYTEGGASGSESWVYDMSVVLKPEVDVRYGSLQIVKKLSEYENSGPATFVFEVVARWEDHIHGDGAMREWRDVVSIDFTQAESKFRLIEKLPVGATVTVTEIYSGSAYQPEEEDGGNPFVQTAVIERADQLFEVSFTNSYNERHTGGHGITNHFAYSEAEDRWIWTSVHADGTLGGEDSGTGGQTEPGGNADGGRGSEDDVAP